MITSFKAKLAFSWDNIVHRFRYGNGRYVSTTTIENARQSLVDSLKVENEKLAQRLVDGKITVSQWEKEMRDNLRRVYTTQYLLGRGGINNMTQRDWGIIGNNLRQSYSYLRGYSTDLNNGRYSDEQIRAIVARMNLYANSTGLAYQRGMSEAHEQITLPHYPRDGSTICLVSCACSLEWVKVNDGWNIFWRLGPTEHCSTCKKRANKAVKIRKGKITNSGVWG